MCGIVGVVAKRSIARVLVDGLKRLEYRGYDSAGVAVINPCAELKRLRVVGKVKELETAMLKEAFPGNTGIAHTRWATHGIPNLNNAHPFLSHDEFALVHNGIIENHADLRDQLISEGYGFSSETDTEVVVHLIHKYYSANKDLLSAVEKAVKDLRGAYALGVISKHFPNRLVGVRHGCPLVLGRGKDENYLASDPLALLSLTKDFVYLEDNDIADVSLDGFQVYQGRKKIEREQHHLNITADVADRGHYRHFMKKEIMEQPKAIAACLESRLGSDKLLPVLFGKESLHLLKDLAAIQLVACGTSYHAALVAKYWFEAIALVPSSVEVASEYRYRQLAINPQSLFITLSQSGETADTLAALRLAKTLSYLTTFTICNSPGSSMTREAEYHFLTRAGLEIGVASTKTFITQLIALLLLGLALRKIRKLDNALEKELLPQIETLPLVIEQVLKNDEQIAAWAREFLDKEHALFISRGALYPIALEGSLKMKEISYIHAEAYPAGELKHGPLALVDPIMPVIATLPYDDLYEKTLSNIEEVRARGGKLYIMTDRPHKTFAAENVLSMPRVHPLLAPIVYTIPQQLLAYHVAVLKGTDVDQPRNLAKSVTVE